MTEPLRRALAEYKEVRPDGLGGANGVGAGGPSLWTVYVHLPEILGPIRQLHEQSHVNPRISQKLVHFVIMIVARYWPTTSGRRTRRIRSKRGWAATRSRHSRRAGTPST
jgi:hypothetical protein